MGARVYMPSLGRFLQPDPVEGGTPSAYVYVLDPINYADYNGQWGIPKWVKTAAVVVVVAVVVVGVVVCVASVACGAAVAGAIASAGGMIARAIVQAAAPIIASKVGSKIVSGGSNAVKGSKATSTVNKGSSVAQQANKAPANTPARLTGPPSQAVINNANTVTKFVEQGRSMVSTQGFKMTEYYYNRLISNGRADFAARTTKILENATSKTPDPKGYEGFYKYMYDGWYIIYNPATRELSHLGPIK